MHTHRMGSLRLGIRDYPAFQIETHMGPLKVKELLGSRSVGLWRLAPDGAVAQSRDVTSTEEPQAVTLS